MIWGCVLANVTDRLSQPTGVLAHDRYRGGDGLVLGAENRGGKK